MINCLNLRTISGNQMQDMLQSITERNGLLEWPKEMSVKPRLAVLQKVFDLRLTRRCWSVCGRFICSMLMKLRGGTA